MHEITQSAELPAVAAVIGCGVIGSGWIARLRLCGVNVRAYDPAPGCERVVLEVHENAVLAWKDLVLPTSNPGRLELCDSLEDAVADVQLVQESVPERLAIKLETIRLVERSVPSSALIASSTSGFRPTGLAEGMKHPERLLVAHPFNPVYLMPLVELVGGRDTSPETINKARFLYRALGMHPLHVRKEIDAFIADRLLESAWREALWLVEEGIATTEEIDDAVRYGFGLRWAQMGMFESYRIAGGEGGMRHYLAQFGKALDWPWSHMTDTPVLDEELIEKISEQSDRQSGAYSIRELERLRDQNLASILRALESRDWGGGATLKSFRSKR